MTEEEIKVYWEVSDTDLKWEDLDKEYIEILMGFEKEELFNILPLKKEGSFKEIRLVNPTGQDLEDAFNKLATGKYRFRISTEAGETVMINAHHFEMLQSLTEKIKSTI